MAVTAFALTERVGEDRRARQELDVPALHSRMDRAGSAREARDGSPLPGMSPT